jgi:hypothetical protein
MKMPTDEEFAAWRWLIGDPPPETRQTLSYLLWEYDRATSSPFYTSVNTGIAAVRNAD